jgi:hypothetical protein
LDWAWRHVWEDAVHYRRGLDERTIFSLIQRRDDKILNAHWEAYLSQTIKLIVYDDLRRPHFIGSDTARRQLAGYLRENWSEVVSLLDHYAVDRLVEEIRNTLRSGGVLNPLSSLVTDPERIKEIAPEPEDAPKDAPEEKLELSVGMGARDKMTASLELGGIRVRLSKPDGLYYEVIGHEGIFFWISERDLRNQGMAVGLIAKQSVAGGQLFADLWTAVGKFTKGLMTAAASPVEMIVDTAAKTIDMLSQFMSIKGKEKDWFDIGYTCLSSTCKQAAACLDSGQDVKKCQDAALKEAVETASIVIPLYNQGRDCLGGDVEACGSIAPVILGLVPKREKQLAMGELERAPVGAARAGTLLTKVELQEAAIRESIGRPRAGDPNFANAIEQSGARKEAGRPHSGEPPAPVAGEPSQTRPGTESPGKRKTAAMRRGVKDPLLKKAIDYFAQRINSKAITREMLEAEAVELVQNAKDPAKVHRPKDPRYDAEITTSDGKIIYKREAGPMSRWERCWNPCKDGAPVHPMLDKEVDAMNARNTARNADRLGRVDPEAHETIETSHAKIEAGDLAPDTPVKSASPAEIAKNIADAKKELKPEKISTEVQLHEDASAVREAKQLSGSVHQSMHISPSSVLKSLDDYVRNKAKTMLGEKSKHYAFDKTWKEWAQDQRRLGKTEVTVQEFHDAMAKAIHESPFNGEQKSALFAILKEELQQHKLNPAAQLKLPYPKTPRYKPGPKRDALEARIKADEKANLRKTIAEYEKVIKRLKGDPRFRGRVPAYRLEVAKLKQQLKD